MMNVSPTYILIRGTVPVQSTILRVKLARVRVTKKRLPNLARIIVKITRLLPVLETIEKVEDLLEILTLEFRPQLLKLCRLVIDMRVRFMGYDV